MSYRIKLSWQEAIPAPDRRCLGLFGVVEERGAVQIAIQGKRMLAAILMLITIGYFSAAAGLTWWLNRNPYTSIPFADTALPWRWAKLRSLRGQAYIAEGLDDFKVGRWLDGAMKLQTGLDHYPSDLHARLALTEFYIMARKRELALQTMQAGLDNGFPGREYVDAFFKVSIQGEDYDIMLRACDLALRQLAANDSPAATTLKLWLNQQKIRVLLVKGEPEEALKLTEAHGTDDPITNECRVMALIALRRDAEATDFLHEWRRLKADDSQQIVRLQARVFREAGRLDDMESSLNELRRLAPLDPQSYGYRIVQQVLAGRTAEAAQEMDDYFLHFSADSENLMLLANGLSEAGNQKLLRSCMDEAMAHGFDSRPFLMLTLTLQLSKGDWDEMRQTLAQLQALPPTGNMQDKQSLQLAGCVLDVVDNKDDISCSALVDFCQTNPQTLEFYKLACNILNQIDYPAGAERLVNVGLRTYPNSPTLNGLLKTAQALAVAETAKTNAATADKMVSQWSEKTYFQGVSQMLDEKRWDSAEAAIVGAREAHPAPAWLASRDGDLRWLEVRAQRGLGANAAMLTAAEIYLDGGRDRARRVTDLAVDLRPHQPDAALELVQSVIQKNPDYFPARQFLAEWAPKAASPAAPGRNSPPAKKTP